MLTVHVCLAFFSWEKWKQVTHTQNNTHTLLISILQSHNGTDDVIHLWCIRVTKALLSLYKHTHWYTHTCSLFFLSVALVSRADWIDYTCGVCLQREAWYLSFVCRFIHQEQRTVRAAALSQSRLSRCKASEQDESGRVRRLKGFLSDIWRIWASKWDICLPDNCRAHLRECQFGLSESVYRCSGCSQLLWKLKQKYQKVDEWFVPLT